MDLIPGLPDDVALECLIQTHYSDFSSISSVSKSWNHEIHLPDFLNRRRKSGKSRVVVVMAQAAIDPNRIRIQSGSKSYVSPPAYRLSLFEPETDVWTELPPPPGFADGLPMFCKVAGVGSELVVLGGWDPKTFGVSRSVFVYSFITAMWRRGAQMPEPARSLFGCATDCENGVVYVAGGHDEEKNALKSVMAYDVAKDEWMILADMENERDECHAMFLRGKLHVIGGYRSDTQGRFEKCAEIFETESSQRGNTTITNFLDVATCHTSCVINGSDMYTCREGHVAVKNGDGKWINLVEMPGGIGKVAYVANWEKNMFVIGTSNGGDTSSSGYVLDLKSLKWSKVALPEKYSGNVQAGCCLEI